MAGARKKVARLRFKGKRFRGHAPDRSARPETTPFDASAPAIEDVLASIATEVPQEEWDRLPADLTDDLDHCLYGTSRR